MSRALYTTELPGPLLKLNGVHLKQVGHIWPTGYTLDADLGVINKLDHMFIFFLEMHKAVNYANRMLSS